VSRVECTCVSEGRKRDAGRADLDLFLREAAIEVAAVAADRAEIAFRRCGRGRRPAGLNIGATFAYALAKATGEPLLFKGDDFARTDIASAG
jgi:ribonuclease VapC